jgi:hypothetical protein
MGTVNVGVNEKRYSQCFFNPLGFWLCIGYSNLSTAL